MALQIIISRRCRQAVLHIYSRSSDSLTDIAERSLVTPRFQELGCYMSWCRRIALLPTDLRNKRSAVLLETVWYLPEPLDTLSLSEQGTAYLTAAGEICALARDGSGRFRYGENQAGGKEGWVLAPGISTIQ